MYGFWALAGWAVKGSVISCVSQELAHFPTLRLIVAPFFWGFDLVGIRGSSGALALFGRTANAHAHPVQAADSKTAGRPMPSRSRNGIYE